MTTLPTVPRPRLQIYVKVAVITTLAAFILLTAHHVTQLIPLAPEDSRFWLSSAVGIVTGFLLAACYWIGSERLRELGR